MSLCFLCGGVDKVLNFYHDNWEKCVYMSKFRTSRNFKYGDITFPKKMNDRGYHVKCYKKFTNLKHGYRLAFETFIQTLPRLCCVHQCVTNTAQILEENPIPKTAFPFPTEETLRQKWTEAIGRGPSDLSSVCVDHFLESDFLSENFNSTVPKLNPNAVPTVGILKPPEPLRRIKRIFFNVSPALKKIKLDREFHGALEPIAHIPHNSEEFQNSETIKRRFYRYSENGVCSLYGCTSNETTVFSFPRGLQSLKWMEALGFGLEKAPSNSFVCRSHFEVSDVVEKEGNIYLRKGALPLRQATLQNGCYQPAIKLESDLAVEYVSYDNCDYESVVETKDCIIPNNTTSTLTSLCRLCAQTSNKCQKLTIDIKNKVTECISIRFDEDEKNCLPEHICENCIQSLNYFYEFRSSCHIANNRLQQMATNQIPENQLTDEAQPSTSALDDIEPINVDETLSPKQANVFKKHKCVTCNLSFVGLSFLQNHAKVFHNQDIVKPDLHEDPFRVHLYVCKMCGEISDNFNTFHEHLHFKENDTISFRHLQVITKKIS